MTIMTYGAFLGTEGAALYLGLSPKTLEAWRAAGKGPRYSHLGRAVRYRATDLDAFAEQHSVEPEGS